MHTICINNINVHIHTDSHTYTHISERDRWMDAWIGKELENSHSLVYCLNDQPLLAKTGSR